MEANMRLSLKLAAFLFGSAGALAAAAPAYAGCGDVAGVKPSAWDGGNGTSLFHYGDHDRQPAIVGLWSTQFFAGSTMIDFGYAEWHSDGTEFLNSGSRAPATQNFCLGTWAQIAPNRFKLNHFALSYDAGTGKLNGIVNIREDVTVGGDEYGGAFTIDVYQPTTKAVLNHVAGRVTGKRVTINTGV
jgi:hypothetical protein